MGSRDERKQDASKQDCSSSSGCITPTIQGPDIELHAAVVEQTMHMHRDQAIYIMYSYKHGYPVHKCSSHQLSLICLSRVEYEYSRLVPFPIPSSAFRQERQYSAKSSPSSASTSAADKAL